MTASPGPLAGIDASHIATARLHTRVLRAGDPNGVPIVFLHGNLTSATWWEETMVRLPAGFGAIAPDQRGFGEADPGALIDATRGLGDLSDDVVALLDHLGIDRAHVVGNSMGGSVIWRLLMDAPERILSATQVAPGSPYGYGGCKGLDGAPTWDDFAGSGGGLARPELLAALAAESPEADDAQPLRSALRQLIVTPPFIPAREDALIAAMLTTHLGDKAYPGDRAVSPNWPYIAPGRWGIANALSPKYAESVDRLLAIAPKVPILWLRGSRDLAVSDRAAADPGTWGPMGLLPGYPGSEAYPPQPMIGQTRAVLERYRAAGGEYREVVLDNAGHAPYIDAAERFDTAFHGFLGQTGP